MKKTLKQTNASAHLVLYRFKIREGSPEGIRKTMEDTVGYDTIAEFNVDSNAEYSA